MLLLKKKKRGHGASEGEKHKLVSETNLVDTKNTLQGKLPLKKQTKRHQDLKLCEISALWIIIRKKKKQRTCDDGHKSAGTPNVLFFFFALPSPFFSLGDYC